MLIEKELLLYYQLETVLRSRILSGELSFDKPIPKEGSRITTRRPLASLEEYRLIVHKRGKSTLVSQIGQSLNSPKPRGSIEDPIAMGVKARGKVVNTSWLAGKHSRQPAAKEEPEGLQCGGAAIHPRRLAVALAPFRFRAGLHHERR